MGLFNRESTMRPAKWTNGKSIIEGSWEYIWSSDCFVIELLKKDSITGQPRRFTVKDDTPEWGKWKLVKERD